LAEILIIEDEQKLGTLLSRLLSLEGFIVAHAPTFAAAAGILQRKDIDIIVSDVKLPDGNGVHMVKELKAKYPLVEIILLTAFGNIEDGVQSIKNGAFDYITKGDDNAKIIPLVNKAAEKVALAKRVAHLETLLSKRYSFDSILGESTAIKNAIALATKVAATDTAVLLTGETGTGKEVFANAIHHASKRGGKSFVAINCAAVSKDLLESELFGHAAGAFTGAVKATRGIFEEANNGTVFLDEIGEMPLELQAKLLRILETGEMFRVGESKPVNVNVRLISATNRDLQEEIAAQRFRSDLYYRLSVFIITLPSLRERFDDIDILAKGFLYTLAAKTGKKITKISPAYLAALHRYHWPGNIRELKNVIERSLILEDGAELTLNSLPTEMIRSADSGHREHGMLSAFDLASAEKIHIQKVLNHTRGNKTEAARLLNIGLTTLYRKIDEYKIDAVNYH
jgi:two-component system, NtrC family, response regulator